MTEKKMDILLNIALFSLCLLVIVVEWIIYLLANEYIVGNVASSFLQDVLGTLLTFSLLLVAGFLVYTFAKVFFGGLLIFVVLAVLCFCFWGLKAIWRRFSLSK